jgi:putative salt-induced outer membrane protein YdiY
MNNKSNMSRHRTTAVASVILCLGAGAIFAQDAAAPAAPAPPPKWDTTAAAAFTLTRGNTESFLATLSLETKRKWAHDELAFGISGGYGENTDTKTKVISKTAQFVQGYGQYNRLFTERLYGGLRLDGQYDGIAGVDYRFKVSPMMGYYLVKTPKTTLAVEAGPSLIYEHLAGVPAHGYWAARFGERFEHKLTPSTKIWQSLDYYPQVDRWTEKYLLVGELGIDTAINKHWSLRVVFQDIYDSEPSPGRKNNDMRLMAGTAYKF